ncbi:unnamed protein product, partial [Aphanomyces euteiches]
MSTTSNDKAAEAPRPARASRSWKRLGLVTVCIIAIATVGVVAFTPPTLRKGTFAQVKASISIALAAWLQVAKTSAEVWLSGNFTTGVLYLSIKQVALFE